VYEGFTGGWKWMSKGIKAAPDTNAELNQALKTLLDKSNKAIKTPSEVAAPKPKPKPSAHLKGEVDSPKGKVKVLQHADDNLISGKYDGDVFVHNDKGWIHKPTGTSAGPNSTEYLTQAANKAGIDLDAAKKKPKDAAERSVATKEDEAKAIAFKQAHPDKSPIPGVSDSDWRQGWDDVSDGYALPSAVKQAKGWGTLWSQMKSYTSTYNKNWAKENADGSPVMNARSRALFKSAPAYVRPIYRGMKMGPDRPLPIAQFVEKFPVGSTLDLRGGASFSFTPSTAESFAGWGRADSLIIEVRSGFTGIPVRGFSNHGHEDEILVGSKLRVVEVKQTPKGWHYVVEQEGMVYDE